MTDREAMQKAFEIIGVLKPDNFVHRELQGEAWDALRQALAQPEQEELIQFKDGKWSYVRKPWVGLTSEDWENTPNTGKQGCERDVEMFDWIEQTLKDKNT